MNRAVSVLCHRRVGYARKTLEALMRCEGVEQWRVIVVMDRPDRETQQFVRSLPVEVVELDLFNAQDPPYSRISKATLYAFSLGFATADFVVHLEEDCVPEPGFLTWMTKVSEEYRDDPSVFAAQGYRSGTAPGDTLDTIEPMDVATWGSATWLDRWPEVRRGWDFAHWDRNLTRPGLLMAHPSRSLIRNIGRIGTQPVHEYDARMATEAPAPPVVPALDLVA